MGAIDPTRRKNSGTQKKIDTSSDLPAEALESGSNKGHTFHIGRSGRSGGEGTDIKKQLYA